MEKQAYLVEKINRYNEDGEVVVELSISKGTAQFDEEYEEYEHPFERDDYTSERFFKDGEEIDSEEWFDGMDEEYEEADWEDEVILASLEEANKYVETLIEDL